MRTVPSWVAVTLKVSVIRAARLMGQADGREIRVIDVVRQLVEGKKYLFGQRGEADLKGFEEAGAGVRGAVGSLAPRCTYVSPS